MKNTVIAILDGNGNTHGRTGLISFREAIRLKARAAGERAAITDATGTLSRAEVDRLSDTAARRLMSAGVGEGSIVAFTGPNTARVLVLTMAIWKLGATPLPLGCGKPREQLKALLSLARPAVAIGFPEDICCDAPKLLLQEVFGRQDQAAPLDGFADVVPRCLRIGVSGGSTGVPKLIVMQSPAVLDPDVPWLHGMQADGTHVVPLNLMDGTGFIVSTTALASGCHVVLMSHFDAEQTLQLIDRHRADWIALTPPLMLQIWKLGATVRGRFDITSLNAAVQFSGGAAPWLKRAWIEWLGAPRVIEYYGATDSRGSVAIDGVEWLQHARSVGRPKGNCEVAILDPDCRPLPIGAPGDIHMRDLTGRVSFRYLGRGLETLPGGWECFGDIGWLDEDGYLYVGDRRRDLIQTACGMVFPLEIEGVIEHYDAVRSAIVIGLPNADGYERIHALIDTAGKAIRLEELRLHLANVLPPHKQPHSIERMNACNPDWVWWVSPGSPSHVTP